MNPDDVDLVLSRDPGIEPRANFTHSVMAAVRREASQRPPLPFPWKRLAWGLAGCMAASAGAGAAIGSAGVIDPDTMLLSWTELTESPQAVRAAWIAVALLVSWLSWAVPTRLLGLRD